MTFSNSKQVVSFVVAAVAALAVSFPALVDGQVLERLPNIYPMNGLPDPYESEEWVDLPDGRTWGSTASRTRSRALRNSTVTETSSSPGAGSDPDQAKCARRTPWTSTPKTA